MKIIPLFPLLQCGPSQGFAEFYAEYPRKVARADAEKAFIQQLMRKNTAEDIIQGAKCFAEMCRQNGTEKEYIPYPARWLRGERWADEELTAYIPPTPEQIAEAKDKADRLLKRGAYSPKL